MFKKIIRDVKELVQVIKLEIMIAAIYTVENELIKDIIKDIKKLSKGAWHYISLGAVTLLSFIPSLIVGSVALLKEVWGYISVGSVAILRVTSALIIGLLSGFIVSVFWLPILIWFWFKNWN